MKQISIIIPIYNEEESIEFLRRRIINAINKIKKYEFQIVLINDGSCDNSLEKMKECRMYDKRFEYISLSRNYGKEIAMLAGLDYCKESDSVILMDADLQDPPELIEKMIIEWENGYDDVYARRISRKGETWLKKLTSKLYYRVLEKMSSIPIQKDTGDFRLLDKRCVNAICQMREYNRCSKTLFSWIGYNKKEILFEREERIAGTTKWNYFKLTKLAIDGITSISTAPLRWSIYVSVILIIASVLYILGLVIWSISGRIVTEINFVILLLLTFFSIQMVFISIFGIYLGKIFEESKNRPVYLLDEINGKKENSQDGEKYEKKENSYININCNHYSTN